MVDVTGKGDVFRVAWARGFIRLTEESLRRIREGRVEKGDVYSVAKVAAILAVKRTPELVPLCHPIPITGVEVDVQALDDGVEVEVTVKSVGKTGVEMEALAGVSAALLAVWDMVKKYEKDERGQYPHTRIERIEVVEKEKRRES
ncbi:MAG TPA: cyclic pyranopterin monophosphate synthase MoaC [Candidatus Korarchaeota archaeon]|nr:cyclic pyranopterin monophosphate synthase MoaC [Candidatus Korarchaeota archaeon]